MLKIRSQFQVRGLFWLVVHQQLPLPPVTLAGIYNTPAYEVLVRCLNKDVALGHLLYFCTVTPGHCPKMVVQLFLHIFFLNRSRPAWYWNGIWQVHGSFAVILCRRDSLQGLCTVFWRALHCFSSKRSLCYLWQWGSKGVARPQSIPSSWERTAPSPLVCRFGTSAPSKELGNLSPPTRVIMGGECLVPHHGLIRKYGLVIKMG